MTDALHTATFTAMNTQVTLQVRAPEASAREALHRAREVFERTEAACTRFVADSPLMRANAAPHARHVVPDTVSRPSLKAPSVQVVTSSAKAPDAHE